MWNRINNNTKQRLINKVQTNYLELDKEAKEAFTSVIKGLDFDNLCLEWLEKGGESGVFEELLYEAMLDELEKYYPDVFDRVDTDRKVSKLILKVLPERHY